MYFSLPSRSHITLFLSPPSVLSSRDVLTSCQSSGSSPPWLSNKLSFPSSTTSPSHSFGPLWILSLQIRLDLPLKFQPSGWPRCKVPLGGFGGGYFQITQPETQLLSVGEGHQSIQKKDRKKKTLGWGVHERGRVKPSSGSERLYPVENVMAHESYRTPLISLHFQ